MSANAAPFQFTLRPTGPGHRVGHTLVRSLVRWIGIGAATALMSSAVVAQGPSAFPGSQASPVVKASPAGPTGGASKGTGAAASTPSTSANGASTPAASAPAGQPAKTAKNDGGYDEMYARYLEAARRTPAPTNAWMVDLLSDSRAKRANDLITINVVEVLSASGSANARVDKASKADVSLPSPLSKALSKALPTSADTQFAGSGGASRESALSATMTASVIEVLPNGDLVVEGVREIEINGDRQIAVLTGIVRQADITTTNVVSSATIGQLRIRLFGKGLVKDSLTPGWLIRFLNKIF